MEFLAVLLEHPLVTFLPQPIMIMLATYFAFKVLDFATGLLKTWKGVISYKSSIMRNGIIVWIGEMVGICFVFIVDLALGMNFYLTGFTLGLYIYKEGGSIAENLRAIGVEMPGIVDDTLESFKKVDVKKKEGIKDDKDV